jgi:hypothetical protein
MLGNNRGELMMSQQEACRTQALIAEFSRTDGVDPSRQWLGKHQKMAGSAFRFLRGSSGLFYADIASGLFALPQSLMLWPVTTVMGDCHLSNFGFFTEEGSSGSEVIFAPNDFDDACIGHAVWDLSRFAVSLLLAVDESQQQLASSPPVQPPLQAATAEQAAAAVLLFFRQYARKCQQIAADPELRYQAQPAFAKQHVLHQAQKKARRRATTGEHFLTKSTLAKLVDLHARPLQFKQDPDKFLRLSPEHYQQVASSFRPYVNDEILDIVSRQGAGTGSMNLQRYYLLVGPKALLTAGEQAAEDLMLCHVVEAKQQRRSAPLHFFAELDPVNQLNDAHLTVDCQRLMQRRPDLVLDEHYFAGAHYLVRSLHHANVDLDPVDICLHPTAPEQQLLDYASACADALALAHSRGDRRSVRFEQAVAATLPAQATLLLQLCQQYAGQMRVDCGLLAGLLEQQSV